MSSTPDQPTANSARPPLSSLPARVESLGDLKQDGPVYLLVGIYAFVVYALSVYLHDASYYRPLQYVPGWMAISLIYLAAIWAVQAIRINPQRPFSAFRVIVRQHWNRNSIWGILLLFVIGVFYGVFTSAKMMLPDIHAFTWDPTLAAIDYHMLGDHDGWKLAAMIIPDGVPLYILDVIYTKLWLFFVLGFSAYISLSPDFRHSRRRFLLAFCLAWIIAGNVLAVIFMSSGPCFYDHFSPDHLRFSELLHSIATTESAAEQKYLWDAYASHQGWIGSGISAFPSVHLVAITLVTLLLRKINIRLFWAGVVLTAAIEIGSVRLGWHYITDGFAGIAIALAIWFLVGAVERAATNGGAHSGVRA